ncbi:unnamed protein product [Choristocarpus tenellus]
MAYKDAVTGIGFELNAAVSWVLRRLKNTCGSKMMTAHLKSYQAVPIAFVARSVKECGSIVSRNSRYALATRRYMEVAVPGFLKWLGEEAPDLTPPTLTKEVLVHTTLGTGKKIIQKTFLSANTLI